MSPKVIKHLVSWVISLALLAWIACSVEWDQVKHSLARSDYWYLLPLTALVWLQCLARAWRWRYLLPEGKRLAFRDLMHGLMLGHFATYILPLRAGEFIRPYFLSRVSELGFLVTFVSVVIERFFDLALVLIAFALILPWLGNLPDWVSIGAGSLLILAILCLVFGLIGCFFPDWLQKICKVIFRRFPNRLARSLDKLLQEVLMGTAILRSGKNLIYTMLFTIIVWLLCFFYYIVALPMLNLQGGWLAGITVAVVLALAVAAPSAPGFLGVFQVACIAALALFAVPGEEALAYSVIVHLHQYVFVCLYGIFVLVKRDLSWRGLRREREQAAA